MRNPIRATMLAAAAVPMALAFSGTASATDEAETPAVECVTAGQHQQWQQKATEWYPAEQVKHQDNLAKQQTAVTEAEQALAQAENALAATQAELADAEQVVRDLNAKKNAAQASADEFAAQVRDANARKNAALADIEKRHGYIAAFQQKYTIAEADYQRALDLIGKAQKDYRTAKNAGDTAGMEAAHAAAEAARVAKADAEGRKAHYGPESQQNQQKHIARQQAIVDEATALGKQLYPQYLAQLQIVESAKADGGPAYQLVVQLRATETDRADAVTQAKAALDAANAELPGLEKKVADIATHLDTATAKAALPVCDDTTPADTTPSDGQPTGSGESTVQRISGTLPVERISGDLTDDAGAAAQGGAGTVQGLAATGSTSGLADLATAGLVAVALGAGALTANRRGRHARD